MQRPYGMHESTFDRYIEACFEAGVDPNRVMQTIGNAPASAGVHAQDGTFTTSEGKVRPYCAAVDIRSKDLDINKIHTLLRCLAKRLIAPYHRNTGSFANNQHIHFIDMTIPMKGQLRRQVLDFWYGKNALVSHTADPYWGANPISADTLQRAKDAFYAANPRVNKVSMFEGEDEEEEDDSCCDSFEDDGVTVVPSDE